MFQAMLLIAATSTPFELPPLQRAGTCSGNLREGVYLVEPAGEGRARVIEDLRVQRLVHSGHASFPDVLKGRYGPYQWPKGASRAIVWEIWGSVDDRHCPPLTDLDPGFARRLSYQRALLDLWAIPTIESLLKALEGDDRGKQQAAMVVVRWAKGQERWEDWQRLGSAIVDLLERTSPEREPDFYMRGMGALSKIMKWAPPKRLPEWWNRGLGAFVTALEEVPQSPWSLDVSTKRASKLAGVRNSACSILRILARIQCRSASPELPSKSIPFGKNYERLKVRLGR